MAGAAVLWALRAMLHRTPAPCVMSVPWRTSSVRRLQLSSTLCAGHNKWSKVKNIKGPKDEARSKMFLKFAMIIKVAVREGGPNPNLNINLANILQQCKSKNMPKASIEAAIKNVTKPATQHTFEARGPGGCLLLIEVLTDNINRSQQDIKRLLNKNGGMLSDGVHHNFTRRGVVEMVNRTISTEKALELAIEAGAEDVQEIEDDEEQPLLQFICGPIDVNKVRASLEKMGMQITSSGVEFVPNTHLSLDQDQLDAVSTLIEALSDYPDVVQVWDNIQTDS